MRWLDDILDSMDMSLSNLQEILKDIPIEDSCLQWLAFVSLLLTISPSS